jgi:hypothetical protein
MSYVLYTSATVLLNCARHRELALASEGPRASQHLLHNPSVEVLDDGFEFSVWVHSSEIRARRLRGVRFRAGELLFREAISGELYS